MANSKHLNILEEGIDVWNKWRKKNPKIVPDLTNARLNKMNLYKANLSGANLSNAELSGADLDWADLDWARLNNANVTLAKLNKANLTGADLDWADFAKADLYWADLNRAHLNQANLTEANLPGANLSMAHLNKANLTRARLNNANLTRAKLNKANLTGADLTKVLFDHTNLIEADLTLANLTGAHLFKADLTRARLNLTILFDCMLDEVEINAAFINNAIFGFSNLKNIKNLNLCEHLGPSVIDFNTIQKSWSLPIEFLRGVGLPDNYIEYLPTLIGEAVQFYSCFISYSHKDEEFANRLHADLQNKGIRCWFAPEDMKIGDKIRPRIDEAIRIHDKLLLILSENSINSEWVEKEVETAFEKERKTKKTILFPICIDDAFKRTRKAWAADIRRTRHIGDFREWKDHDKYKPAFERLLRDLKARG